MDFNDHCATPFAAEANKRVEYNYGMVLGVGELRTEQNYFLEKHRRHARGLHGYGTVAGLAITAHDTDNGPEIRVSPGLAIDPHGREICVPETRCALLNDWLVQRQQAGELSALIQGSIPNHVRVYVTLCHRECKTDDVPIPVGPCQSLDRTSVPSRIQDAFDLDLVVTPPAQVEEEASRAFAALMARVSVGSGPDALTAPDDLVTEIRTLRPDQQSPGIGGSEPTSFVLDPVHAVAIVRTALRVFVTEVQPMLVPEGGGCMEGPRNTTCVLLGQLDFDVHEVGDAYRVLNGVQISQDDRPLLLSSRALQEQWIETKLQAATGTESTPLAPPVIPFVVPYGLAPGPDTRILGSAEAARIGRGAAPAILGSAISALRFRRNGAAIFNFPPPADLVPGAPFWLRLHWTYNGTSGMAPTLEWEATLRLIPDGGDLSEAAPGASVTIHPSIGNADGDHLLVTDPVELTLSAPARPILGALEVRLITSTPIPRNVNIYLVSAELSYTGRGGGS